MLRVVAVTICHLSSEWKPIVDEEALIETQTLGNYIICWIYLSELLNTENISILSFYDGQHTIADNAVIHGHYQLIKQ